ncbi:MAG: hypothetical protein P4L69_03955 [Desulfosporosinus sp.]|nr:hypothetical protein [Desulfosporosinus sp.]
MKIRKRKLIIIFFSFVIFFIFLSGYNYTKPQENVKIVKFFEDSGKDYEQKGFQIIKYKVINYQDIQIPRVWITFKFLTEGNNAQKIRYLLDKGYNILIEGNDVYPEDVYNFLNIDLRQRVLNGSKKQDIEDDRNNPVLHRSGVMIFENNKKYFAISFTRESINDYEGFFTILNMDNNQKKNMYGGYGYVAI